MRLYVFTVYDSKAKAFITPFFLPRREVALRAFADCANDSAHQFGKFAEDFTLYELGAWDDGNAVFVPHPQAENLGLASQFKTARVNGSGAAS